MKNTSILFYLHSTLTVLVFYLSVKGERFSFMPENKYLIVVIYFLMLIGISMLINAIKLNEKKQHYPIIDYIILGIGIIAILFL